jgi:hypothetical protein
MLKEDGQNVCFIVVVVSVSVVPLPVTFTTSMGGNVVEKGLALL